MCLIFDIHGFALSQIAIQLLCVRHIPIFVGFKRDWGERLVSWVNVQITWISALFTLNDMVLKYLKYQWGIFWKTLLVLSLSCVIPISKGLLESHVTDSILTLSRPVCTIHVSLKVILNYIWGPRGEVWSFGRKSSKKIEILTKCTSSTRMKGISTTRVPRHSEK